MMLEFAIRRVSLLLFMLFTLSVFTFSLGYLFPGDPLTNFSGIDTAGFSQAAQLRDKYHLDDGYIQQYLSFLGRILQGDWGQSFASGGQVFDHVATLAPATFELAVYALLVSVIFGVPAGILAALSQGKWLDKAISGVTLVGYS